MADLNDPSHPTLGVQCFPRPNDRLPQPRLQHSDRWHSMFRAKAGRWLANSVSARSNSRESGATIPLQRRIDRQDSVPERTPNEASGDCDMGFTAWKKNEPDKQSEHSSDADSFSRHSKSREQGNNIEIDQQRKLKLFEELILPHLNAAYNLARWLTRNEHDAQDVVQEAYLRAFRFFDTYRGGDGKSWLMAVVRNTCITWLRHERRDISSKPFDEMADSVSCQAPDQEEKLVKSSRVSVLRNCIEMLPLEFREVLVMRELEEMSYRQISEVADLPVGTVMSRLSRARKRLEECAIRSEMGKAK
jgi:RNA polymerase sigma-70 factor (ECF subfamily)